MSDRKLPRLLQTPAVLLLLVWMLVPLGMTLYFSFSRYVLNNLRKPEWTTRNSKTIKHAYACIREQVLEELESDSTIDIVYSSIVSPDLTSNAIYEEVKYQAFKYVEDNYNELSWLINND